MEDELLKDESLTVKDETVTTKDAATTNDAPIFQNAADQLQLLREATLEKHHARAQRFGTAAPPHISDVTLIGARRYSVTTGFITGFDINTNEQQEKKMLRQRRFATPCNDTNDCSQPDLEEEQRLRKARMERFGPLEKPTPQIPTPSVDPLERRRDVSLGELLRHNVIHVFGVDDLSTNTVLQHFRAYGPSWCEWINDSSCNVCFEDIHTTNRVLDYHKSHSTSALFDAPPEKMDDTENGLSSMPVASADGILEEITQWRPFIPVEKGEIGKTRLVPLWVRIATEADIRPTAPNPKSRWSRTVTARAVPGRSSDPGTTNYARSNRRRPDRRMDGGGVRGMALDVRKDKSMAILKARKRMVTRADLDRPLAS